MKGGGTALAVGGLAKHYFVMHDINLCRDFRYVPLELDMCFALDMLPYGNEFQITMHEGAIHEPKAQFMKSAISIHAIRQFIAVCTPALSSILYITNGCSKPIGMLQPYFNFQ